MSLSNNELFQKTLIELCVKGDRFAQSTLYKVLAPKMFAVCLRYGRNRQEAEEILQEGFLKMFRMISQFRNRGVFEGWVRKIMVNCALQKLRRKVDLNIISLEDAPSFEKNLNITEYHKLEVKELTKMVQELSPGYRIVFNLYVFEGLKHKEISEALNISIGTSKSNLNSARAILQKKILNSFNVTIERLGADNK